MAEKRCRKQGCELRLRRRWRRSFLETTGAHLDSRKIATRTRGESDAQARGRETKNQVPLAQQRGSPVGGGGGRRMGLVSWVKRQYYHYSISTGTYSFYPAERIMVNAFTFTLLSLTAYYVLRGLWFGALCLGELVSPNKVL